MTKRLLLAFLAGFLPACNPPPVSEGHLTAMGNSNVFSFSAPLMKKTRRLPIEWYTLSNPGQMAVADILSYGSGPYKVGAPAGWTLIREDVNESFFPIRQSLYWHLVAATDPDTHAWTFSKPVDAQGAIVLLDHLDPAAPVDASGGGVGAGNLPLAKSLTTRSAGDLILLAYATNYGGGGLSPLMPSAPATVHVAMPGFYRIVDQSEAVNEYWIDATYQAAKGKTPDSICVIVQNAGWVAAQIALRINPVSAASAQH